MDATIEAKRVEIFVSYSHKDDTLREKLGNHLRPLEREGLVTSWHDRKIEAGNEWKNQIDRRLETADVILLLVSPDFIASDYCFDVEMVRAMERHEAGSATVIPIILRPVDWKHAVFAKLQALPRNAKPITTFPNRDLALEEVAAGIRAIVATRHRSAEHPHPLSRQLTKSSSQGTEVTERLFAIDWPAPAANYEWKLADRETIFAVFEGMVTGASSERILLLSGDSNSGKTAALTELAGYARHLNVRSSLLDCKGCPALGDLFNMLVLDLGRTVLRNSCSAPETTRLFELIADLRSSNRPLVLFFDTYEQASEPAKKWIENQLFPRFDQAPGLLAVVGGQDVPDHNKHSWGRLARTVTLHPIEQPNYWLAYIHRKWKCDSVRIEHVEALTAATNGEPGELSALLDTMIGTFQRSTRD